MKAIIKNYCGCVISETELDAKDLSWSLSIVLQKLDYQLESGDSIEITE